MTIKQDRLVEAVLKEENRKKPLIELGASVGYTSRQIYRPATKKHIREQLAKLGHTKEAQERRFVVLQGMAIEGEDLPSAIRCEEGLARISGHFGKDTATQGVIVSINDALSQLKSQHSVEGSPKEDKGSEQVVI